MSLHIQSTDFELSWILSKVIKMINKGYMLKYVFFIQCAVIVLFIDTINQQQQHKCIALHP